MELGSGAVRPYSSKIPISLFSQTLTPNCDWMFSYKFPEPAGLICLTGVSSIIPIFLCGYPSIFAQMNSSPQPVKFLLKVGQQIRSASLEKIGTIGSTKYVYLNL